MIDLGHWAETLGLRRKKTFATRVKDAAEDVVDTVLPVLSRPARAIPSYSKSSRAAIADAFENVADAVTDVADSVTPTLKSSRKMAKQAFERTGKTASRSFADVSDMASDAASTVASSAAATGAAAAGVAAGVGGALATVLSTTWWLFTFAVKAALLVGVAYAGWQWLQSRRDSTSWAGSTGYGGEGNTYSSSTYGTVTGSPSLTPATTH